jgi:integrase
MSTAPQVPQLRFHKPTNQFYVYHLKKRVYMGAEPTVAAARYEKWKGEFLAALKAAPVPPPLTAPAPPERTVAEVLAAYYAFALAEYADAPKTLARIWEAVEAVRGAHADAPVSQFRGPQLKAVREGLAARLNKHADRPLSRTYINYLVAVVQRMWRWALSEDLVPADCAATIAAVKALRKGKGGTEPRRVLPPLPGWDEALVELAPHLRAMLRVQAYCGMRPQDVCRLRRKELSTSPAEKVEVPDTGRSVSAFKVGEVMVWLYAPAAHKTSWKGKTRLVAIGPRAQALLAPLLADLKPDDYVFSPAKTLAQIGRGNQFKKHGYSRHYETQQYAQLVDRAIGRANAPRVEAGWHASELVPRWSPNQLRHLAATVVGDELDREHARALLGQSSADVIDVYLEQQMGKAGRAAAQCG